uniref:Uncharacterized protein n=1 Tax=viral metagenome TaxID=1070528 RepID=A0A6M3LK13_9ZZZZ
MDIMLNNLMKLDTNLYACSGFVSERFAQLKRWYEKLMETAPIAYKVDNITKLTTHEGKKLIDSKYFTEDSLHLFASGVDAEVVVEKILGPIHRSLGCTWEFSFDNRDKTVTYSTYLGQFGLHVHVSSVKNCRFVETGEVERKWTEVKYKMLCDEE